MSVRETSLDPGLVDPATPMSRRVPLSDLMTNTPRTEDGVVDVSPEDKVVWKLSPRKLLEGQTASQESPSTKVTRFLSFLDENDQTKKVRPFLSMLMVVFHTRRCRTTRYFETT